MTTLLTKVSSTADAVPTAGNLTQTSSGAELAVNTTNKKLYSKNSSNAVVEIAGALHAYPVGAVYISVVATSPAILFGGDWDGRVGFEMRDGDDNNAESDAGGTCGSEITNYQDRMLMHFFVTITLPFRTRSPVDSRLIMDYTAK